MLSREAYECGVQDWMDWSSKGPKCSALGRNMRPYGVDMVLPCSEHWSEEMEVLMNAIVSAFDAGVTNGMELEREDAKRR